MKFERTYTDYMMFKYREFVSRYKRSFEDAYKTLGGVENAINLFINSMKSASNFETKEDCESALNGLTILNTMAVGSSDYSLYRIINSAKKFFPNNEFNYNMDIVTNLQKIRDSLGTYSVVHFEGGSTSVSHFDEVSYLISESKDEIIFVGIAIKDLKGDGFRPMPFYLIMSKEDGSNFGFHSFFVKVYEKVRKEQTTDTGRFLSDISKSTITTLLRLVEYKELIKNVIIYDINKVKKEIKRLGSPSKKEARSELVDGVGAKKIILIGPKKIQLDCPENNKSSRVGWKLKHSFEVDEHIRMQWVGSLKGGTRRQEPIVVKQYEKGVGLPKQKVEYLVKGYD